VRSHLSHYLRRHRQEYYDRLQAVRDDGDWEGWLEFFLRGVAQVSVEATETARRVLVLRERNRAEITTHLGRAAASGHLVLESLFDRPILSVRQAQELTGTGFAAANKLIARMTDLEILREITGHARNRRFRYDPYVRLFTDELEGHA
jgi:Fic family protein